LLGPDPLFLGTFGFSVALRGRGKERHCYKRFKNVLICIKVVSYLP
jgi:hypothetical protein